MRYLMGMTDREMADILARLRGGEELSIGNAEGRWGFRFSAGRFIEWARYPYSVATDVEVGADDVRKELGDWDYSRVCALMSPGPGHGAVKCAGASD